MSSHSSLQYYLCITACLLCVGWITQPQSLEAQIIYRPPPARRTVVIQPYRPQQNQFIQPTQIPLQTSHSISSFPSQNLTTSSKVSKTEAQWRQLLSPMQFYVTRQKGTEPAFSGALLNNKAQGTYKCACCGQALFHSSTKFESGTGWPSYFKPISPNAITNVVDRAHGMDRTETICSRCDAHLGHVFKDGPAPTGLRYCMNSASLKFDPVVIQNRR